MPGRASEDGATGCWKPVVIAPTGVPGQLSIVRAGSGSLIVANFQQIQVVNGKYQASPVVQPAAGPASPLRGFAGSPLTNVDVATFSSADTSAATASSFDATFNWGDGTTSAGTIVPDASNPTLYHVEGSHTYDSPSPAGGDTIAVSVGDKNFDVISVPGVTVSPNGIGSADNSAIVAGLSNTSPTATISGAKEGTGFSGTLATFTDNDPTVPASRFNATIAWGDGQVTQGAITADSANLGQFDVGGPHVYAMAGTFSATVAIGDSLATVGSPITVDRQIDVAGASISQSPQGVDLTYATNRLAFTADVVSFVSANPLARASDFVASIRWGDGSSGSYSAGMVVQDADGQFEVSGTHVYSQPMTANNPYLITVLVKELSSGVTANIIGQAVVADAPINAQGATVSSAQGVTTQAVVATFGYGGGPMDPSYFGGSIQWGDGLTTTLTAANFVLVSPTLPTQTGPLGTPANDVASYQVVASHAYATPGTFSISVRIQSINGSTAAASSSAIVTAVPPVVVVVPPVVVRVIEKGQLNPSSDSGISDRDAITNNTRPSFFGTATPGTVIELFANPVGTSIPVPIGQGVADASGAWSITTITLANGRFNIEAIGLDSTGVPGSVAVILRNPRQGPLVVDTVAPRVESLLFRPLKGEVLVTFQDDASGIDPSSIIDGANYSFDRFTAPSHSKKGAVSPVLITGLLTSLQVEPTAAHSVLISIDHDRPIKGQLDRFMIRSGGIKDVAGNAIDGEFSGSFGSGNGQPGADFVANLGSIHTLVLTLTPATSSASSLNLSTVRVKAITEPQPSVIVGQSTPRARPRALVNQRVASTTS